MAAVDSTSGQLRRSPADYLARLPYWLLLALLLGALLLWSLLADEDYNLIFNAVSKGVGVTLYVCLISFGMALLVGLAFGLARVSRNRLIYEAASFYVEIIRGVPMLVILFYIAFVGAPGLVDLFNWVGGELQELGLGPVGKPLAEFGIRRLSFTSRAVLALVIGYSAFIAEIFRAGIESVERGQMEAALSLGMSRGQAMRYVILPQAIRRVLPPLGNDFIAMLKDSALVSVLGVQDITQLGRLYATSTFRFFETYNVVAFLYLVMTIGLSLVVRFWEKRNPLNER
ncbi:MAG: amino acid ABC transporter permease [Caldilineaceae bacterium SB0661_bin_32]|uniref:Amino acid ABC transporter permease n=1 Tax=Caldilineaceae bacterium SB0661_bin_32 TaxID=2605255 RepID=A0A6B1D5B6_9CHLR|nr:amino acid ABC transporter permease [Caldilineaceae bacterium SB0661_bin_32]